MKTQNKAIWAKSGALRAASLLGLALGVLAHGAPAGAESPWSRLARAIAPDPVVAPAATPAPAAQAAAVPNEDGAQVASLNPAAAPVAAPETEEGNGEAAPVFNQFGKPLDLGLESEDRGAFTASDLFENPEIQRLLGDKPRFTYNADNLQDPMMVPWVRNAAIFKELSAKADTLMGANKLDEATAVYKRILDLNDVRYRDLATAKLTQIAGMQNAAARDALAQEQVVVPEAPVELPGWVRDNTTATIVAPSQVLCMVGDYMLGVGDTLPNYPDVKIASIDNDKVLYQVKNKTFEVPLTNR